MTSRLRSRLGVEHLEVRCCAHGGPHEAASTLLLLQPEDHPGRLEPAEVEHDHSGGSDDSSSGHSGPGSGQDDGSANAPAPDEDAGGPGTGQSGDLGRSSSGPGSSGPSSGPVGGTTSNSGLGQNSIPVSPRSTPQEGDKDVDPAERQESAGASSGSQPGRAEENGLHADDASEAVLAAAQAPRLDQAEPALPRAVAALPAATEHALAPRSGVPEGATPTVSTPAHDQAENERANPSEEQAAEPAPVVTPPDTTPQEELAGGLPLDAGMVEQALQRFLAGLNEAGRQLEQTLGQSYGGWWSLGYATGLTAAALAAGSLWQARQEREDAAAREVRRLLAGGQPPVLG